MMPGVTCLPCPSISTAPAGAERFLPTAAIRPSTTRRSAFSTVPEGPSVQIVAPRTTTARGCASGPPSLAGSGRISVASGFSSPAAASVPGVGGVASLAGRGGAGVRAILRLLRRGYLDLPAVDPPLRPPALLREGLAGFDGEVGDLARLDRAQPIREPELPRRHGGDRRQ